MSRIRFGNGPVRHVRPGVVIAASIVILVALAFTFGKGNGTGGRRASTTHRPAPPPSSVVAAPPTTPAPLTPVTNSTGRWTFDLAGPHVPITMKATAQCWIEVRAGGPQGSVTYTAVLQPGQTVQIDAPNPGQVRLGMPPAVSMTVDGRPLPAFPDNGPLNVVFEPAGGGSTT